jgi:hypothetical protein
MFKNEKTHIDIIITALLGLAGFDGETIEALKEEEKPARPASTKIFTLPTVYCKSCTICYLQELRTLS